MVRLRRATSADVEVLTHWDAQPHVIAATGDDDVIDWRAEVAAQGPVQETLIWLAFRPIVALIGDPPGLSLDPNHAAGSSVAVLERTRPICVALQHEQRINAQYSQ